MKYTLLDLTQTIMSSLDADEINSISDTTESAQVVKIIRTVYFDIINRANLPEQSAPFSLEASGDPTKPVLMTLPTDFKSLQWLRYDTRLVTETDPHMSPMHALPIEDFLTRMYQLNIDDANVGSFSQTIGNSPVTFRYQNDRPPTYYMSYSDSVIIFDSYDSEVDVTLQKSKTLAYGQKVIPWYSEDTFTPDLDEAQFALLLNESKSLAFNELKQEPHPMADRNSRRGWTQLQHQKTKIPALSDFDNLPNFSRIR